MPSAALPSQKCSLTTASPSASKQPSNGLQDPPRDSTSSLPESRLLLQYQSPPCRLSPAHLPRSNLQHLSPDKQQHYPHCRLMSQLSSWYNRRHLRPLPPRSPQTSTSACRLLSRLVPRSLPLPRRIRDNTFRFHSQRCHLHKL